MHEVKNTYSELLLVHGRKQAIVLAARRHGLAVQTVLNIIKNKTK